MHDPSTMDELTYADHLLRKEQYCLQRKFVAPFCKETAQRWTHLLHHQHVVIVLTRAVVHPRHRKVTVLACIFIQLTIDATLMDKLRESCSPVFNLNGHVSMMFGVYCRVDSAEGTTADSGVNQILVVVSDCSQLELLIFNLNLHHCA
jgi:hypothetical protein